MYKEYKKFKILTIFLLIFFSSLAIFCPTGKSGPLEQIYANSPFIELEYNQSLLDEPVVPYDEPKQIPIKIKTRIMGPAADIVVDSNALAGLYLIVHLSMEEVPDGCYASINPPLIRYQGINEEYQIANATLSFTIDRNFPAFTLKKVKLNMSVERLGIPDAPLVKGRSFFFEMPFQVGYDSKLSFSYPEKNVKNIGPDQTAEFPIEIENWGNAESNVNIEVVDVPKGWQANIKDNLTLGTNLFGGDAKEIVSLNVKPPIDSGYREDRAVIKVKMTPVFYKNSSIAGESHYLYFIVQSKGVSTPGFEMPLIVFALFFVFLIIWRNKKFKEKNQRGGK